MIQTFAAGRDDRPGTARLVHNGRIAQVFVFAGDRYLGWDCFEKPTVVVGTEPGADLVLAGLPSPPFRVEVHLEGERIIVQDRSPAPVLRVNGRAVETALLQPLDVVTAGPYTLKIRQKPVAREGTPAGEDGPGPETPSPEPEGPGGAAAHSGAVPEAPEVPEAVLVPDPDSPAEAVIVTPAPPGRTAALPPDDLPEAVPAPDPGPSLEDLATAAAVESLAALMELAIATPPPGPEAGDAAPGSPVRDPEETAPAGDALPGSPEPEIAAPAEGEPGPEPRDPSESAPRDPAAWLGTGLGEEDDEDEEDRDAPFTLAGLLTPEAPGEAGEPVLEVLCLRAGRVTDVCHVEPGRTWRRGSVAAALAGDGGCRVRLDPGARGWRITLADGAPAADPGPGGDIVLPPGARASIRRGPEEILVRPRARRPGPAVPEPPRPGRRFPRSLLTSSLFHAVVLVLLGLFGPSLTPTVPEPPETRFVRLDPRELEALRPRPPAPKPKPKPKPRAAPPKRTRPPVTPARKTPPEKARPRPAPVKTARKKAPPKAPPKPAKAPSPPALARSGKSPKGSPSASPEAGGGHGGNVLNRDVPRRNVKKEGVLGALGIPDGIPVGASQAVAAVTNLDAVRSARPEGAALKVGGIVGKLGSSRIEVPDVAMVSTKGSAQAIASAGVGGRGTVAALERGRTGRGRVRAMVQADLKAPVRIQGGMSREEVKRVIDAHMDEISYCYETSLIEDPGLVGKITFEWRILTSGQVGEVRIRSSSIRSDSLHGCISRAIRSWRFPKPRGAAEVIVSYPFVFDVVGF